jgi:hypothetical protein
MSSKFVPSIDQKLQFDFENACIRGSIDMVKDLIEKNNKINIINGLTLAYKARHMELSKYLLKDMKIDISKIIYDVCLNDELDILDNLFNRTGINIINLLVEASRSGNLEAISELEWAFEVNGSTLISICKKLRRYLIDKDIINFWLDKAMTFENIDSRFLEDIFYYSSRYGRLDVIKFIFYKTGYLNYNEIMSHECIYIIKDAARFKQNEIVHYMVTHHEGSYEYAIKEAVEGRNIKILDICLRKLSHDIFDRYIYILSVNEDNSRSIEFLLKNGIELTKFTKDVVIDLIRHGVDINLFKYVDFWDDVVYLYYKRKFSLYLDLCNLLPDCINNIVGEYDVI